VFSSEQNDWFHHLSRRATQFEGPSYKVIKLAVYQLDFFFRKHHKKEQLSGCGRLKSLILLRFRKNFQKSHFSETRENQLTRRKAQSRVLGTRGSENDRIETNSSKMESSKQTISGALLQICMSAISGWFLLL